jgi:glucose/arabinose dehydrogenase
MKTRRILPCLLLRLCLGLPGVLLLFGGHDPARAQLVRVNNTTLRLPSTPPPLAGYTTVNALGSLTFSSPVCTTTIPGDNTRLFVVERGGTVQMVTGLGGTPVKTPFLNLASVAGVSGFTMEKENGLLGLAFHPDHLNNGEFFIFYSFLSGGLRQRVARMKVRTDNPYLADTASLQPLITQLDQAGNHNGGTVAFGPDGYLYVSLGDEGSANDVYDNARHINKDFFGAILRLDVDRRPGSLPPSPHASVHPGAYAIPPDNPFVGATSWHGQAVNTSAVRTEIWATGLRNPFRFSFDAPTGRLFCGDVGQDRFEEVDIIVAGADYGWSWREGRSAFTSGPVPKTPPVTGFTPVEPIFDYARTGTVYGRSVTGGVVYRGRQMPELVGDYVFADFASGQIVALRQNGATWDPRVLAVDAGIVGFGHHPVSGEVIFCDLTGGQVKKLSYLPDGVTAPATLAATGAFSNVATLTPAAGVVPYEVNAPFWSDHAFKSRWFALRTATMMFGFQAEGKWTLPTGAVWIKHFEVESIPGNPATRRRIETRFLVKTASDVYGLTYRWREDQSNADLVPPGGLDDPIPGSSPARVWRFPARGECQTCHTPQGGFALGFNTAQLNRTSPVPGHGNQLHSLAKAGYLTVKTLPPPGALPALAALDDTRHSIDFRARSYLSANCSPCHQLGTGLPSSFDARHDVPLNLTGLVDALPTNPGTDPANRLIAPGDTDHSVLLHRVMGTGGFFRMPPIGSNVIDSGGAALLTSWIQGGLTSSLSITTQPADLDINETGTAVFNVAATGSGTLRYQWRKDRADIPGETGDTLTIANVRPEDAAGYDVVVQDANGSLVSRGALLRIVVRAPTVTNGPPPEISAVCAPFHWQLTSDEPSAVFTVQGLPLGLRYDSASRAIVGVLNQAGPHTLTISARTVAGVGLPRSYTFSLIPLPLGGGRGASYGGLVERSAVLNQNLGGRLLLTISSTGMATGTLALGPLSIVVKGQVSVSTLGAVTLSTSLARVGKTPLALSLNLDPATGSMTGTVADGPSSAAIDGRAFIDAASLSEEVKAALVTRALQTHLLIPPEASGDLSKPQGAGYLRWSGTRTLTFNAAGRMADGSTATLSLSALDPHLTAYLKLYGGKGILLGRLAGPPVNALTLPAGTPAAGNLRWIKQAAINTTDRLYVPAGFDMTLTSATILDNTFAPARNRLGVLDAADNARLLFLHAGLVDSGAGTEVDQVLRLDAAGRAYLGTTAPPVGLTLTHIQRTGEFSGTFRLPGGAALRTGTFRGLIMPDPSNPAVGIGRGYFTLPATSSTTSPILSGSVEFLMGPVP